MKLAPFVFVLLWSTGFIGAKYGLPYADPFIFLAIRVLFAAFILYAVAILKSIPVKLSLREIKTSAMVGISLHFAYLGGVFYGISVGVPAGIAATVTSLQPILVSLIGVKLLGERLSVWKVLGLILGFTGVAIIFSPAFENSNSLDLGGIIAVVFALLGGTTATLYQKRNGGEVPLITGTAFQYFVAGVFFLLAALLTRGFEVKWNAEFIFSLTWLILGLSVGAVLILFNLLQKGSASQVSSLLYLVPPATAIEAYFLFGEKLGGLDLIGMAMTAMGVFLVMKKSRALNSYL